MKCLKQIGCVIKVAGKKKYYYWLKKSEMVGLIEYRE